MQRKGASRVVDQIEIGHRMFAALARDCWGQHDCPSCGKVSEQDDESNARRTQSADTKRLEAALTTIRDKALREGFPSYFQIADAAIRKERTRYASECDHQWTDYGTLKSGDNPRIEIEVCLRCGGQRKKR